MDVTEGFKSWAIVEVMGHQVYAGFATDASIGGQSYLRVDVPEFKESPAFTKYLGPGSIFSITPVDEATARATAETRRMRPFDVYTLEGIATKLAEKKGLPAPQSPVPDHEEEPEYDDDYEDLITH